MEMGIMPNYKNGDGSVFDILKYMLSVMVVCIHVNKLPDWYNPILRIAVPLFFMMTSYFFFKKQRYSLDGDRQKNLLQFIKRNILLFLFWTVLLLLLGLQQFDYQCNVVGGGKNGKRYIVL